MDSQQIRRTFIDFFTERGHVYQPSASLIPVDPTLLLTNAGMVPFKPYFLGQEPAPFPRAVSVQKCVRTIDIDIIGTTQRHLSFFEMMGNFSFGDYFKTDAIAWSFELVTEGFGLDPAHLWYTVYETDDEAEQIWIDHVEVPPERVQRGGKDNFWQMGVPGPCGPCSEIFWDKGEAYGEGGGPMAGSDERYVEIWNLVFMQNIQDQPYHVIGDLPAKSIDTGMGLERTAAVLQGVDSAFEADTIRPIIEVASAATGVGYGTSENTDVSLRILADHGRTMTTLIGDGVVPSNEGRGYVLRRVLRRAVRHAWQLGGDGLITPRLVEAVIDTLGPAYPDLPGKQDHILAIVEREELRFRRTLESGHQLLDAEIESMAPTSQVLPGQIAFKLHDTFGFPFELTKEIASERGVAVDEAGFEIEMEAQRTRARKAWKGGDEAATAELYRRVLDETGPTSFTGYEQEAGTGKVLAILAAGEMIERAEHGREVEVFLDVTPFYAEGGGQVGDSGSISTATGVVAVVDTRPPLPGLHGHRGKVVSGYVQTGQDAELAIDSPRREKIRKSHTGTHVLHWSLREVLGSHAHQAGSLVEAGRLRFDFSHFTAVADQELAEVERLANLRLIENGPVTATVTTRDHAEEMGALAFFGDKYGSQVRVVKIGDFSVELCGGTHTHTAGQVGPLIITSEASIGSNIRRVEALTGEAAYHDIVSTRRALEETGRVLRAPAGEVPARVRSLLDRIEQYQHQLAAYEQRDRAQVAARLAGAKERVGDTDLVVAPWPDLNPEQLRQLATEVRRLLGRGVVVLGSTHNGKGALVAAVSPDLAAEGTTAGELTAAGAAILGGGGSRDPELAQAGGPRGDQLPAALDAIREHASRLLARR
jgi:alanyl-tRNA synthetase